MLGRERFFYDLENPIILIDIQLEFYALFHLMCVDSIIEEIAYNLN